jgi:hypothetical protein
MGNLGNQPQTSASDVPELTEFNIKLYLGIKEFLSTLSSFGECSAPEMGVNGGVKTH